jgi:hypothetical protein
MMKAFHHLQNERGRDHVMVPPWKLDAKTFERLSKDARKVSRKMEAAARQWLKDGNRRAFLTAMNDMTTTCNNCHSHLVGTPGPIFALIDLEMNVSSRQDAGQ